MSLLGLQVYSADEVFVTGTFAGLIPVSEVDGRVVGNGQRGPVTQRLQQLYTGLVEMCAAGGRQSLESH
jgi:branched-subunit amino acid aminotransferase/4-amino-4-deoxychorismate lyase